MPESTKSAPISGDLSIRAAQACVLDKIAPLGTEDIAIERALGRVLAAPIYANRDLPPYDVSAMDGYAVRAEDVSTAPSTLRMIDDIQAGDMPRKPISAGQCARIMTGAPVPPGADTVVRVEETRVLADGSIEIALPVKAATDIRVRGENIRTGDVALPGDTEISPGALGVLATAKAARIEVYRLPRVAILANGNELEALTAPFDAEKIPDANSYALMAQVQAQGIEPVRLGIARDEPDALAKYLRRGLEFDVLLVSGGTSVGVHDHVRPTLAALGVALHFYRVQMRPGHPVAFGTTGRGIVFCLPGNPVSSMVCFEQFVLPALRALGGHRTLFRRTVTARLTQPARSRPGRVEFVRVTLARSECGDYAATPLGKQSSGDLLAMARADGLLVVPAASRGLAAGESARVQLLETGAFQESAGLGENTDLGENA
ncbi:MAG: molybdopterin molybdotransferase MoeA [Azoarcus sp.]|nr:molybdopterin molybdotransferase MoeA [Azoarcus sp.]